MKKRKINVFDYSTEILKALSKGILLTVKGDKKVNSMVISWGHLGIEWNKLIFITYVRENRYTKAVLDKTSDFTINIPLSKMDAKIFTVCGTKSGRNVDKIKETNLTLIDSEIVSSPAIKELPITLECKVLYKQKQVLENLPEEIVKRDYPQDIDGTAIGANRDIHTAYYGEIVAAYIIED
ncbi:flavin reductase [Fusobacterium simiae]|uniref:Flavin reductase n=1 Tax=Fusobacterium simiae TaxID=855 RepID=A0ABT4DJZ2_FUSSI|nr:flavin reductase [Fusobacterium simiae]MCY7008919.1 flavin reductase [Fusobacterium simiae]